MLTELALNKPKQRRIPELLAKEFDQLSLTCDEPDQLAIPEQYLRRFTPVRPRIFSAFGHRPNFTHADSFIVDTYTRMPVYVHLEHLAQEMAIPANGLTLIVDNGQENARVRLAEIARLDELSSIELQWSAENLAPLKPFIERFNRSIKEQFKNMGLDKTSFKRGRTTRWSTAHHAQSLDLSNHN